MDVELFDRDSERACIEEYVQWLLVCSRPETCWDASALEEALAAGSRVEELPADVVALALSARLPEELRGGCASRSALLECLLRTQRLWHGERVTPLIASLVGAEGEETEQLVLSLSASLASLVVSTTAPLSLWSAWQPSVRGCGGCTRSPVAHNSTHPSVCCTATHLGDPHNVAAIAAASMLLRSDNTAWRESLHKIGQHNGATCLLFFLCANSELPVNEADMAHVSACCVAAQQLCELENIKNDAEWRSQPAWLLAAAAAAHAPLCAAYSAALFRRPKRTREEISTGSVIACTRDAAFRLRCVLAVQGEHTSGLQATVERWGALLPTATFSKV